MIDPKKKNGLIYNKPVINSKFAQYNSNRSAAPDRRSVNLLLDQLDKETKDQNELRTTGQIKKPVSIAYKNKVPVAQPKLSQDNRSAAERKIAYDAMQKVHNSSLIMERPLIYAANPEKIAGDMGFKGFDNSEADRERIMLNRHNPYQTRGQRFVNNVKMGLDYVPAAAANVVAASLFGGPITGAGFVNNSVRLLNNSVNPMAGSGTQMIRLRDAGRRFVGNRLTTQAAAHEAQRLAETSVIGASKEFAENTVADQIRKTNLTDKVNFLPRNMGKTVSDGIDRGINKIEDLVNKRRVLNTYAQNKKFFESPEGRARLTNLGVDPNALNYPSLTFKNNEESGFFGNDNAINIDFAQARHLKKGKLNGDPRSVLDHEIGHWIQLQKAKNSDQYANAALRHHQEVQEFNTEAQRLTKLGFDPGAPPRLSPIESVVDDYETNADKFLHDKFNTKDETAILSRLKRQGATQSENDLRFDNALHFTSKQEPLAYVRELRRDLLNSGVIKNLASPITETMLTDFLRKNPTSRMAGIIGGEQHLIKAVRGVINGIPATVPATLAVGGAASALDDSKDTGGNRMKKGGLLYK